MTKINVNKLFSQIDNIINKTKYHLGVDIGNDSGTPVYSILSGVVVRAELVDGFGSLNPSTPNIYAKHLAIKFSLKTCFYFRLR